MIDVLIPNYFRPHHIPRLIKNLRQATENPYLLTFIIESDNEEAQHLAHIYAGEARFISGHFRCFAHAINTAYFLTNHKFFFPGVDDITFSDGWDHHPIRLLQEHENKHVICHKTVGQDCPDDGIYKCHFTIRRSYVRENSLVSLVPNMVMYPYYHHEVDRELYWTAKVREVELPCPDSVIVHSQAYDEVQKKTISKDDVDRDTYNNRRHLFRGA